MADGDEGGEINRPGESYCDLPAVPVHQLSHYQDNCELSGR